MALTLLSIAQIITALRQGLVAALANNPPEQQITDFSEGTLSGAYTETVGEQLGFVQGQAPIVQALTRAATSIGADLDSFIADYGCPARLPATFCGSLQGATFSRNQASTAQQLLEFGTTIQNPTSSPSSAIQYQVVADTTNSLCSIALGGYVLPANQTSMTVAVQAVVAGTGSAVLANTLTVIASPGVPFDTVTNIAMQNGQNAETDPAVRVRFQKYIDGLACANNAAIANAVLETQTGMTYTINPGLNASGAAESSFFTVVVDDGSGAISASTLTTVSKNVDAIRAVGIAGRAIIAPTNVEIQVVVSGTQIAPTFDATATRASIQQAITAAIAANGVGGANVSNAYVPSAKLPFVTVADAVAAFIGQNAGQGLLSYASITVNGEAADIALTNYQLAQASSVQVS